MKNENLAGIILAGGNSIRMGTDKALLALEGKTLLLRAVELCRLVASEVLISSNNPLHAVEGCVLVPDGWPGCGPLAGICSCLKKTNRDWNLTLSVDAPFVVPDFVDFLMGAVKGYDAVIPVVNGRKQPLIAIYHRKCVHEMEKQLAAGNYKMHDLLERLNVNYPDATDWLGRYPRLFDNLNRREDL